MLRLILVDAKGEVLSACDAGSLDTPQWVRDQVYPVVKEATFRDVPAGDCEIRLVIVDPRTGKPIALPLAGGTASGGYTLGGVRCLHGP